MRMGYNIFELVTGFTTSSSNTYSMPLVCRKHNEFLLSLALLL